jgi:4-amino-4-deoxy-L-arabinose transferase-like glycosyltransferase
VCVAILALAAALRFELRSQLSTDLGPKPDAIEYASVARSFANGSPPLLSIDGHSYPGRYPWGVSLLLAPLLAVTHGPTFLWVGIAALAVATVGMTWMLARRSGGGAVAAAFAAFVVAISPRHAVVSTLVMSEIPSAAALLGLGLLFMRWLQSRRSARHLAWIGVLAGAATSIRWSNALVVLPMFAGTLFAPPPPDRAAQ